jgi:hypothetical protein
MVIDTHQEAQVSGLVYWHSGELVLDKFLDNVDNRGRAVEV